MPARRILVIGASGCGTSTLGRGLAGALASQHFEVDDVFWLPTDPPFRDKRPEAERVALMQALFLPRRDWVLSGSPMRWGDAAILPRLTHATFTGRSRHAHEAWLARLTVPVLRLDAGRPRDVLLAEALARLEAE